MVAEKGASVSGREGAAMGGKGAPPEGALADKRADAAGMSAAVAGVAGAGAPAPSGAVARASYALPFEVPPMTYEEALAVASDTGFIGSTEGPLLEVVVALLDELGRPDCAYDCIQIAGTNGKTSTTRYTAGLLRFHGLRTMLYTSPHLVRYNERIALNGMPVDDDLFAQGVAAACAAGRRVNDRRAAAGEPLYTVSAFDLLTVAALVIAALAGADVAVLEVGLGGRWDATSATDPCVVGVTGIGLDHTGILGDTLEAIAAEKAAIIKPGRRVVLGEGIREPEVERVMLDACARAGVQPVRCSHRIEHRPEALLDPALFSTATRFSTYEGLAATPSYQAQNIAHAIRLAEEYLGCALDEGAVRRTLLCTRVPGRFDVLRARPLALIDACHNPQSVEAFVHVLDEMDADVSHRPTLLLAALADKDVEGIARILAPAFPRVRVTQTSSGRALPAEKLAGIVRAQGTEPVSVHGTVAEALAALDAADEPFMACGSITLAGEVAAHFGR